MNRVLVLICCISVSSLAAGQKKASAGAAMTDQQFVDLAVQTDMIEAHLGQLADSAASAQPIKDYARMLVADHTNDFQELSNVALQANLTVPTAIDAEHNKAMIDPFEKLRGTSFDHRYVQEMIAGHTKAIAIYKKEAEDASNPGVKSYADKVLPVLEKHLAGAKDLEKVKTPAK
jgi:putative membrane protein